MLIVESVEQLAKCMLSGLHARSEIATIQIYKRIRTYFCYDDLSKFSKFSNPPWFQELFSLFLRLRLGRPFLPLHPSKFDHSRPSDSLERPWRQWDLCTPRGGWCPRHRRWRTCCPGCSSGRNSLGYCELWARLAVSIICDSHFRKVTPSTWCLDLCLARVGRSVLATRCSFHLSRGRCPRRRFGSGLNFASFAPFLRPRWGWCRIWAGFLFSQILRRSQAAGSTRKPQSLHHQWWSGTHWAECRSKGSTGHSSAAATVFFQLSFCMLLS